VPDIVFMEFCRALRGTEAPPRYAGRSAVKRAGSFHFSGVRRKNVLFAPVCDRKTG
jgi:hypothetical protein